MIPDLINTNVIALVMWPIYFGNKSMGRVWENIEKLPQPVFTGKLIDSRI